MAVKVKTGSGHRRHRRLRILCVVARAGAGFYFFSQHSIRKRPRRKGGGAIRASEGTVQGHKRSRARRERTLPRSIRIGRRRRHRGSPNSSTCSRSIPRRADREGIDPFRLLRFQSRGSRVDFNGGRLDLEDLKLTVDDLERFGPTLIVDHSRQRRRVLVWSQ